MNDYIKNIALWAEVVREYAELRFIKAEIDYLDDRLNHQNIGNSLSKYRRPKFLLKLRLFFLLRRWEELGDVQIDPEGNRKVIKTANHKLSDLADKTKEYYKRIQKSGVMYGIDNPDNDDDIFNEFTGCYDIVVTKGPNGKTSNAYLKMTPKEIKEVRKNANRILKDLNGYLNHCEGTPQSHESLRGIIEIIKQH